MSLGSKFKMQMNYSDNLMEYITDIDSVTEGIVIEFDPEDSQIFFFATSEGLFRIDKQENS